MITTATSDEGGSSASSGGGLPATTIQQIEGGLVAAFSVAGMIVFTPTWWWVLPVAFVVLQLSTLGYARSPGLGAAWYNAVHTYAWPTALGLVAVLTSASSPQLSKESAIVGFSWAFRVGLSRGLGLGLKLPDAFTHTHMGWIGRDRRMSVNRNQPRE